MLDYHMHCQYSADSPASLRTQLEAAQAAGLQEICFTDHVEPLEWNVTVPKTGDHDWSALERSFAQARAAAGDRIRLRLGVELGDAPWNFAWAERQLERAPELDFVIGSIHSLPPPADCNLALFSPADEAEARARLGDYLSRVEQMVRWGRFQVVGHLTLPLRYAVERSGMDVTFDGHMAEMEDVLRAVVDRGLGIECNTNRGHMPLPDREILTMYRRLGGEIITLGSDAHRDYQVGKAVAACQELLRQCGFTYFCTFEKMQPIFHKL